LKRLCCLLLATWALPAAAQPGSGPWNAVPLSDLRVGIADVDITPAPGAPLAGYSSRGGPSTGVHDRLRATAVVFDDGQARAAIVAVDLLNLRQADGEAIVAAIERAARIPRSHVLLNASHTHAAHSLGKSGQGRAELASELATKIAGAVARAIRSARTASLGYGEGTIDFNVNRRVIGPDGKAMVLRMLGEPGQSGIQYR
jgi:neutral ceramidase